MIGSLRGTVLERLGEHQVLLEVQHVGYVVSVTPRTLAELEPTSQAFLYVHHHLREDHQTLYGFLTRDERATFQMLMSAHGVGPSLALSIISTLSPASLMEAIAAADANMLTSVPGVGKKTAERLLVELKSKNIHLSDALYLANAAGSSPSSDVRQALMGLGYTDGEIHEAMRELPASGSNSDLLREALRILGARRA